MPFRIDDDLVTLDGHCSIEEAQPLHDALRQVEEPIFDLAAARVLHTAIAQILLASGGALRAAPQDPILAACLRPLPIATP